MITAVINIIFIVIISRAGGQARAPGRKLPRLGGPAGGTHTHAHTRTRAHNKHVRRCVRALVGAETHADARAKVRAHTRTCRCARAPAPHILDSSDARPLSLSLRPRGRATVHLAHGGAVGRHGRHRLLSLFSSPPSLSSLSLAARRESTSPMVAPSAGTGVIVSGSMTCEGRARDYPVYNDIPTDLLITR